MDARKSRPAKWWEVALIAIAGTGLVVATLFGVNLWRTAQAEQQAAQEAAVVAAAAQAEYDALVVKFSDPAEAELVKTPPPPPPPPVAEEPGSGGNEGGDGGSAGPLLCPPGATANSSDGYNDTSCYPDVCFSIAVPDPAHPECDVAFQP